MIMPPILLHPATSSKLIIELPVSYITNEETISHESVCQYIRNMF